MRVRLFTSGKHNNLEFSNEDIVSIYNRSNSGGDLAFVLGHPKNDLPIVGWLKRKDLRLYDESEKKSIGFDRANAEFSDKSISVLRELQQNKISVRLKDGIISHVGLVKIAAVKENNHQDFADMKSYEDKLNACFSFGEELHLEDASMSKLESILNDIKSIFKHNNKSMNNKEKQDFSSTGSATISANETEKLKEQLENAKLKQEIEVLKKENADFSTQVRAQKIKVSKDALSGKIKELGYDESKSKSTQEFGESLLEKDADLFDKWLESLESVKPLVQVQNGSVVNAEFGKENKSSMAEELKNQIQRIKN